MNQATWDLMKPILAQAARDVLRTVGMFLAARGFIQGDAGVAAFIGAGMTIAGLFWGWFTTKGYLQVAGLLKKLTATKTPSAAVEVAKVMPSAEMTGAADKAKSIVSASGVASVLLVAFALSLLLAANPALAQTGNIVNDIAAARAKRVAPKVAAAPASTPSASVSTSTDPLSKLMADLAKVQNEVVTGVITDINDADADAGSIITPAVAATATTAAVPAVVKDPISHACYPALVQFLQSLPVATAPTGTYVLVQLFQKKRDFIVQIQAGLPAYLRLGCAALLGDEIQTFTKSMALIGVTVAANGLLPGVGGLALPALPALAL